MRYLHPDVLDNGHALIKSAAIRALLLPLGTTNYAQAVASALVSAIVSSPDFTLSPEGSGRKLVFGGKEHTATAGSALVDTMHVAYTDGNSRLLWLEPIKPSVVVSGQVYALPVQTLIAPQPEAQA